MKLGDVVDWTDDPKCHVFIIPEFRKEYGDGPFRIVEIDAGYASLKAANNKMLRDQKGVPVKFDVTMLQPLPTEKKVGNLTIIFPEEGQYKCDAKYPFGRLDGRVVDQNGKEVVTVTKRRYKPGTAPILYSRECDINYSKDCDVDNEPGQKPDDSIHIAIKKLSGGMNLIFSQA